MYLLVDSQGEKSKAIIQVSSQPRAFDIMKPSLTHLWAHSDAPSASPSYI
jgi:hypothetical protein